MASFSVVLKADLEDGGYVAIVPELPGCISDGDTREQALEHVKEAIQLYLESILEEKKHYQGLARKGKQVEIKSVSISLPS